MSSLLLLYNIIYPAKTQGGFFLQLSLILAGFDSVFGGTSPCWQLILAPFFVAGLISATPKRLCKSWLLVPWQTGRQGQICATFYVGCISVGQIGVIGVPIARGLSGNCMTQTCNS